MKKDEFENQTIDQNKLLANQIDVQYFSHIIMVLNCDHRLYMAGLDKEKLGERPRPLKAWIKDNNRIMKSISVSRLTSDSVKDDIRKIEGHCAPDSIRGSLIVGPLGDAVLQWAEM